MHAEGLRFTFKTNDSSYVVTSNIPSELAQFIYEEIKYQITYIYA